MSLPANGLAPAGRILKTLKMTVALLFPEFSKLHPRPEDWHREKTNFANSENVRATTVFKDFHFRPAPPDLICAKQIREHLELAWYWTACEDVSLSCFDFLWRSMLSPFARNTGNTAEAPKTNQNAQAFPKHSGGGGPGARNCNGNRRRSNQRNIPTSKTECNENHQKQRTGHLRRVGAGPALI